MAAMGKYCKAYEVARFRLFPGWTERASARSINPDDYLFLQENLTVTDGVFIDENVIFDQVTDEWRAFCTEKLNFSVPDFENESAGSTQTT